MSNLSSNKKYHYLYKTVNKVNGKFYYGMHSTNNLEDGYLGSGTALRAAFRKHGKENFKLTILEFFESREELESAEKQLISEQMIKDINCYNIKPGGSGGFTLEQTRNGGKISGSKHAEKMKTDSEYKKRISEGVSRSGRERYLRQGSDFSLIKYRFNWKGNKHNPESIEKMRQSHKNQGKGCKNSQYGTCWITNEIESKKISKSDLVPEGWRLGRKIK